MVLRCCVPNCGKTSAEAVLHRFPHKDDEIELFNEWITNIGRQDLKHMERTKVYQSYRVCHNHFPEEVKINPQLFRSKSGLQRGAKPTLLMPYVPEQDGHVASTSAAGAIPCGSREMQREPERAVDTVMDISEDTVPTVAGAGKDKPEETNTRALHHEPEGVTTAVRDAKTQQRKRPRCGKKIVQEIGSRKAIHQRWNILRRVQLTRAAQLTPRAKCLYTVAKKLKSVAATLDTENATLRQRLRAAVKYSESDEFLATKVNRTTLQFLLSQVKQQKKEAKGRRYTVDDKVFALALMKQSPKGYKLLQKVFALPSRKTLTKLLRRVPFNCGVNRHIMQSLRSSIARMSKLDRYAVLLWDEISLEPGLTFNEHEDTILGFADMGNAEVKPPKLADHATVFMLRGIRRKWKQPLSYFFVEGAMSAPDLQRTVVEIIREAREAGITVVATVSDQMSVNCSVVKALHQATDRWCAHNQQENRFCGYLVDGAEVVHIFDPPHLLKCIRNNLLQHNAVYTWKTNGARTASWADIVHFYENDSREDDDYKTCSRLTDSHIYPDKIKKMKVKNAAQVFSHRVASIMHERGRKGVDGMPGNYCDTSDFLLFFDKLFDSVNGLTVAPIDGKVLRTAISSTSGHLKFWEEALPVLRSIKFISATGAEFVPPTVRNWEHSIRGLRYLWNKLHGEGFDFLCLKNFNQDPLENFFGLIRSHGVRNINPTPSAFKNSFKSLILNNFTATHAPGSNCEVDESTGALDTLRDFLSLPAMEGVDVLEPAVDVADDGFKLQGNQSTLKLELHAYLAGYVARQLLRKVACKTCRRDILTTPGDHEEHGLIRARAYNPRSLLYTHQTFRELFSQCCEVVHNYLPKLCHHPGVGRSLIVLLNRHVVNNFSSTCPEHNVVQLFFRIFVRFYIFTWTCNVNKILKGTEAHSINDAIKQLALKKCTVRRGRQAKVAAVKGLVR